jgi:hypothetical protein
MFPADEAYKTSWLANFFDRAINFAGLNQTGTKRAMPRGGPRPNSGRKNGSRNKRSIGIAERMVEAGGASTGSAATQPPAKKLARDVLEDFMLRFTSMAERETDPIKFERYARFAVYCAQSLAPYQSPTLRAVMVAPQPEKNDTTTTIRLKIFDHDGNELKDSSSGLSDRPDLSDDDPIEACKVYRRLVSGGN